MKKVLIVDDNEENLYLLETLFKSHGFDIMMAKNGREAIELAHNDPPDIIVSDILMPVMDGFTLLKHWKKDKKLKNIPFIIYTATYTDPEDEKFALSLGADIFIVKPQEVEVLVEAVNEFIKTKPKPPFAEPLDEEMELFRKYNEILFKKLEKKMSDLEIAYEKIKESEARYRSIFENSIEGIFQSTPEGRFLSLNPAIAYMHGYASPEEMITAITDIGAQLYVNPEDRERLKKLLEEKEIVKEFEHQEYRKDGSIIWVSLNARAVRDEKNKILYYEGYVEDITDRKLAEERIQKILKGTVNALSVTIEVRDPYTAGHQRKVADLANLIAKEMGLPQETVENIRMAGAIHDIGKIAIPSEILSKPSKLTPLEMSLVFMHPQTGYDILKDTGLPYPIAEIIYEHHERLNGSGYPRGLKNEEILLEASIIAICDVVEAISSHRPYRPALGIDCALSEIEKNKGILYHPEVVDVCLKLFREKGFRFE